MQKRRIKLSVSPTRIGISAGVRFAWFYLGLFEFFCYTSGRQDLPFRPTFPRGPFPLC